jgi:hypothetical protein
MVLRLARQQPVHPPQPAGQHFDSSRIDRIIQLAAQMA